MMIESARRFAALGLVASLFTAGTGPANAVLAPIGGGQAVLDTNTGFMWTADANLALSETFGVTGINAAGRMNWGTASLYVAAMNAASYLGYDDWRLPSALNPDGTGPCAGSDCVGSDFGTLYYGAAGLTAGTGVNSSPILTAAFSNMQEAPYWYAEPWSGDPTNRAWVFTMNSGNQNNTGNQTGNFFVWAVRDVPAPAPLLLVITGVLGLAAGRRFLPSI